MFSSRSNMQDAYPLYTAEGRAAALNGYYSGSTFTSGNYCSTDVNSEATLPRRRSHRPRGCRGGRKNRKPLAEAPMSTSTNPKYETNSNLLTESILPPNHQSLQNVHTKIQGDDLSPFHHVKTSNVWDFGSQTNFHNNAHPKSLMMLPPPVPSALFEIRRRCLETGGGGLKMLPSFDDSDSASESIIPPPMEEYVQKNPAPSAIVDSFQYRSFSCDEVTVDTVASCSSSSSAKSSGDDSENVNNNINRAMSHLVNHQQRQSKFFGQAGTGFPAIQRKQHNNTSQQRLSRKQELENGSLFVTSPRSFLFGEATQQFSSFVGLSHATLEAQEHFHHHHGTSSTTNGENIHIW